MNDPVPTGATFSASPKVRAARSASRRGGFAARDSLRPDSDSPSPPMRKAGSLAADDSAARSQIASVAVTSTADDVSAASGKSLSPVAKSHDSTTPEIAVKKSSSRWADRPVPVLQVEFPEPWSIIAHAASADADGGEIAGDLKWSGRRDLNPGPSEPHSDALPDCATPRSRLSPSRRPTRRDLLRPIPIGLAPHRQGDSGAIASRRPRSAAPLAAPREPGTF